MYSRGDVEVWRGVAGAQMWSSRGMGSAALEAYSKRGDKAVCCWSGDV